MHPIVIIGTGLAGYSVAREYRKLDRERGLILISRDDGNSYSKPMLSNALAQGKTAETLKLADAAAMAKQLEADIITGKTVTRLDPDACTLDMDHETLTYGHLVLALGAEPVRLAIDGDGAGEVLSVNDLQDYARFRAALDGKQHVTLIGAGLIGCEFANDLISAGFRVSVIDLAATPLGQLVPPAIGQVMRDGLAGQGVDWHLGQSVARLEKREAGYQVALTDGSRFSTDLVFSAVGLRPRTDLAATAGIPVGRGINVDRELRTNFPYVYALGDCAEVEGRVLPYVMPIMQAARALARTLAGEVTPVTYPAMPVVVKTPACPLVVSPPAAETDGEWQIEGQGMDRLARFVDAAGKLTGFALTGTCVQQKQALTKELPPILG